VYSPAGTASPARKAKGIVAHKFMVLRVQTEREKQSGDKSVHSVFPLVDLDLTSYPPVFNSY
jgi:hypothetical protein